MRSKTVLSLTVFLLLLGGCASTSFKTTWVNPDAQPVALTGRKVVVVAMNVPTAVRNGVETAIADELTKLGAKAVPSHSILASDATVGSAKEKLAAEGYDAGVVIRVTDKEQEVYSTPGVYAPYGAYGSYWGGYGGGWGGGYAGGEIRTNTNVFVETLVYSVALDKLVWSGLSVTVNPSNLEASGRELIRIAVEQMKKTGKLL